jgi:hypothetical protein
MSISEETKLAWFDRGAAAFERAAPGLLKSVLGDEARRDVFGREISRPLFGFPEGE